MKLSRVERWILSNQYKILEKLYPDEADYCAEVREVIDSGYELEYAWAIDYIYPDEQCLSTDQCREVLQILSMYRDLKRAYEALDDKSGINAYWIEFPGFDGNEESHLLGYCRHVCRKGSGKYEELNRGRDDFNSHAALLGGYRRMLRLWEPLSRSGGLLNKSEIIAIINEMPHPESPIGQLKNADVKGPVQ